MPLGLLHIEAVCYNSWHVITVAGKFDRYLCELHEEVDDNQVTREDGVRQRRKHIPFRYIVVVVRVKEE